MRLRRLDLTRYGKFTDKVLEFGEAEAGKPDFHIVYGLNEAGKSTAFSAYLDLLFGIPLKTPYSFLHPNETMQIGGLLEFDGATHDLVRTKKRSNTLSDPRGQPVNEALLSSALGGIGRDAYRTMFSLDDLSLKEGGEDILKSEGDLGALLFSASAGLADISRVLTTMRQEADGLYRERASKTELAQLKARLAALKERRSEIDVQASAFAALSAAELQASKAHETAETELATHRMRHAELGRLLRALPAATELKHVQAALADLAGLPRPAKELGALLPRLVQDETRLETRRRLLEEGMDRLREELDAIGTDAPLLALSSRIEALADSRARHRSAEPDLPRRRVALIEQDAALSLLLKSLEQKDAADPASLILPARLVSRLRDLIEERSGIETARAASERETKRIQSMLEEIVDERERLGDASQGDAGWQRLGAQSERLQRSDRPHRLASEERAQARLREKADAALATLGPLEITEEALKTVAMPDRRQLERWRDQAVELSRRRALHRDRIRTLETERREVLARRNAIREGAEALDDQTAAGLRSERNRLWQAHLDGLDRSSALAFEKALRDDDAATALRLSRAQDLAELRQADASQQISEASLQRERELLAEVDDEIEHLGAAITAVAKAGFPGDGDLEDRIFRLQAFAERHREWLSDCAERDRVEQQVAELSMEIRSDLDDFATALSALGVATPPKPTAEALFHLAERHIAAAEKDGAQRSSIEERERTLRADARERARDHQAALDAAAAWQAEWEKALGETWFGRDANVSAVRANLDALSELPALLREREQLVHRIDLMEKDQQAFTDEVMALCGIVGLHCSEDNIRGADEALLARFEAARRAKDVVDEKQSQIAAREADREKLDAEIAEHAADRERLLAGLGVETLAEAGQQLERLAERDRLEARMRELTGQILADLRAPDLGSAMERIGGLDQANLEQEQALLAEKIDRQTEEARDLYGKLTVARSKLEQVGGDSAVAALEAERATVLLSIEELALRYLKLRTGALAAGSALDLYRERHRSTMMKRASEAFQMITRGDYSGLSARPDKDRETLIGIPRDGGSRLTDAMSTGTRYQLYLALRLAGYREFAEVRPPVPFIADDIMETFDELRSEEVFRLFGEMAGIGQVIYLTHHRHLCEIAKSVVPEVKIHAL